MQDGGTMLRELKDKEKVLKHWQSILPTYAELQLESASKVDELLAVGCLDRRLKHLPNQLRELVEDARILRVGEPDGLLVEERAQLFNSIPSVEHACQRLNDFGGPETLHNDDFHDANIFIGERGPRFFDWGEACVAHSLFSLEIVFRILRYQFYLEPDAPELSKIEGDRVLQLTAKPRLKSCTISIKLCDVTFVTHSL